MNIVYAQRVFFPTVTAHAVHTCTTVGEVSALGVDVDFIPGGTLGPGRTLLADFFRSLGFSGAEADAAKAFSLPSRTLYGLWFRVCLGWSGRRPEAVFHATSLKEAVMALGMKKRWGLRAPVVFEIHHLISRIKGGEEGARFLAMERRAFAEADAIIFNCRELREQTSELLPRPKNALVLPLGFNQRVITPLPDSDAPCRDICYVGTLQKGKGVMGLVDMLALLPEFRLTVVGGKPEGRLEELRRKAVERGVADRVTLCGQVPQARVRDLLPAGGIFVIPLRTAEDFLAPMKMYEALGLGLPIAATPMPSLQGFLTEGETAVFSETSEPAALAAVVRDLAANGDLRRRMRAACRAKAGEHTNARRATKLVEIWGELQSRLV